MSWKMCYICEAVSRGDIGDSLQELLHLHFPRGYLFLTKSKQRSIFVFFHASDMTCFQLGTAIYFHVNRYLDDQSSANTLSGLGNGVNTLWLCASEGMVTGLPIPALYFKERWPKERPQEEQEEMTKDWGGVWNRLPGKRGISRSQGQVFLPDCALLRWGTHPF